MTRFASFADLQAACLDLPGGHRDAAAAVASREQTLTKPPRSLGRLEQAVAWLSLWQGPSPPRLGTGRDPGVRRQSWRDGARRLGLSGRGHGADGGQFRCRRCRHQPARAGRSAPSCASSRSISTIRPRTSPQAPPWTRPRFSTRWRQGYEALSPEADLVVLGEMGIGNTTAAAAISAALFGGGGARWAGLGTGVDDAGLARKRDVIDSALARHAAIARAIRCAWPRPWAAASWPPCSARALAARHRPHSGAARRLRLHRRRRRPWPSCAPTRSITR